jgi:hypothetical protein
MYDYRSPLLLLLLLLLLSLLLSLLSLLKSRRPDILQGLGFRDLLVSVQF